MKVRDEPASKNLMGKNLRDNNFDGWDFSMALLIASDLSESSLRGANLLGADLRDTDIRDADLCDSIFLTQEQVNAA